MIKNMNDKWKSVMWGSLASIGFFFLLGIPTDLIDTALFTRMVSRSALDYFFLTINSLLLGVYVGLDNFSKKKLKKSKDGYVVLGGGVTGFLAFGCPICNKLLVLLIGISGALTYIEPYRPILGVISIIVIGGAIIFRFRKIKCTNISAKKSKHSTKRVKDKK